MKGMRFLILGLIVFCLTGIGCRPNNATRKAVEKAVQESSTLVDDFAKPKPKMTPAARQKIREEVKEFVSDRFESKTCWRCNGRGLIMCPGCCGQGRQLGYQYDSYGNVMPCWQVCGLCRAMGRVTCDVCSGSGKD